jgi:hypothetical protein
MQTDPGILAERKKIQLEILLKDSDLKKNMRSRIDIETVLRDLKHKSTLIQMEINSKETQLKKTEAEFIQLQNELIKLKHQMSGLSHN